MSKKPQQEPKTAAPKKTTDIVYVLGNGSLWQNNELRYSLRSVEKHLKNYGNVIIVGTLPEWLTNVIHIPATDPYKFSASNILHKLRMACKSDQVADNFLFMNDDHFIMKNQETKSYPYYYSSNLDSFVQRRGMDTYGRACFNSQRFLKSQGVTNGLYFDVHFPMLINKHIFTEVFSKVNIDQRFGHIIKSIYANSVPVKSELTIDCKASVPPKNGQVCYSSIPNPSTLVRRWLFETYPERSRFEV